MKKKSVLVSFVRLVRFFWFLTFIIYFVAVFLCYFQWPDPLSVNFDSAGEPTYIMGRSQFFYAANIFMVSYNLIFILFNAAMTKMPVERLNIPNRDFWMADTYNSDYIKHMISNWSRSLVAVLNLMYTLWLVMICYANLEQYDMRKSVSSFWFLAPLLFLIILGWTLFAVFRLRYKKILIRDNKIR